MPKFDYRCPNCGVFEMEAKREERQVECACGFTATRLPYSGVPALRGGTVVREQVKRG